MNQLSNVLPNGTIVKYENHIYQTGGIERHNDTIRYLVTSSIYGWEVGEIQDSDKLLLRDGEKRISRLEYRPDDEET